MIVFLTLLYVGVLFLLVKIKVIQLTLFWKLSPVLWAVLLFIVFFIPMQWGAPSGQIIVYKNVIEIIPNVSGEVIDVPINVNQSLNEGDIIFKIDPTIYQAKVDEIKATLKLSEMNLERAAKLLSKKVASQFDFDRITAERDGLLAKLQTAEWELDETVVRAPSDGYVVALTLRPGQRVSNLTMRSWVSFVDTSQSIAILWASQSRLRHVEKGQAAEIAFELSPGKIVPASVAGILKVNPEGQMAPTGNLPSPPSGLSHPYAVRLKIDPSIADEQLLYGGALGTAAVYTESQQITHVIRKIMLRM
ncbi:MAG: HlyD family efflux transporter periplasmic adaptor subunit, partial [Thiotrichaceae bacterium]|nr:HlyD family efflux transporter periplasmic adaptor subunit [Thiotrichaceae bacterium]